jgi:hypothetical protein
MGNSQSLGPLVLLLAAVTPNPVRAPNALNRPPTGARAQPLPGIMVKRKPIKLEPIARPSGGPGKSRNYRWEVWNGGTLVEKGEVASGYSGAMAEAHAAAERIQDHYEETAK